MSKKFENWLDEFVQAGADPKDVTNWSQGGSGSGIDITPFVVMTETTPMYVDFSKHAMSISREGHEAINSIANDVIASPYAYFNNFGIQIVPNESETQLIASIVGDYFNYQDISTSVVIYEGDVNSFVSTEDILEHLPTVAFYGDGYAVVLDPTYSGEESFIHN